MNQREQILAAARALGPAAFNRLIASVAEVRTRGRLRYWQEKLLAQLAIEGSPTIFTPSEFITVFDGAEPLPLVPPVITREQFFENPNHYYYLGRRAIAEEWIAEAWETFPEFRENVTYEFAREASKVGDLDGCRPHLQFLARIVPLPRLIELYESVRAHAPHREAEFRPTFKRVFGKRMAVFPAPLRKSEIVKALGKELAEQLGIPRDDAYPD